MMNNTKEYKATKNACKLCMPLGATLAFKGVEGCVPFLHGSQGCSTYIRRYMISHYKEPIDVASSNFSEATSIFGGRDNLLTGIKNIVKQYAPSCVGVASTCLSETIGDDVPMYLKEFQKMVTEEMPPIVHVSTPSYQGSHSDGFYRTIYSLVKQFAENDRANSRVNLFINMQSPEDIRYLKQVMENFGVSYTLLPDYSETLDGESWEGYTQLPKGGTPIEEIVQVGGAKASIQLGRCVPDEVSVVDYLQGNFGVPGKNMGIPIGLRESDRFFMELAKISGKEVPKRYVKERGRLLDAMADGHKYVFGKRALVYGEEDLVVAMVSFLDEIGIEPTIVASGASGKKLGQAIELVLKRKPTEMTILQDADFEDLSVLAKEREIDIVIGHSKGYYISRELGIPLVRIGFPIHDRLGGARILHVGYEGAIRLMDAIANALIEYKQEASPVGYKYM